MADKSESIEGRYAIWCCMGCGHNHYIRKDSCTQDGLNCEKCRGPVKLVGDTNQKPAPLRKTTISVGVDVSNAIKGLKVLQREAKKTVQALKEVDVIITTDKPRLYSARYECLLCDHNDCVRNEKKDYREVLVCPKCKGAFVDTYYKNKFNNPKGLI